MSKPLYLFVDVSLLLDVHVFTGNIGFGLVKIVITHIIFNSVVREELFVFRSKLCSERLVVRKNECRLVILLNYISHRESLSRASHS